MKTTATTTGRQEAAATPSSDPVQVAHPAAAARRMLGGDRLDPADVLALQRTLGNRVVQRFLVQRREAAAQAGEPSPHAIQEAASRGIASGGVALPHFDRIQAAFGAAHDLSGVRAHVGEAARAASTAMGAEAYASGEHVAFRGEPSLWVAAHEAAHVVQQRSGVHLAGGVGAAGDAYERHADAIADRVVSGRSAAGLLGGLGARAAAAPSAVQMVKVTLSDGSRIDTAEKTGDELKEIIQAEGDMAILDQLHEALQTGDFLKPKQVTQAGIKRAIDKEQANQDWGPATGHSGSGMWPPDVTVRAPHSFAGERVRQVLRHVATALYYFAKSRVKEEQEVQAMLVGEQLFVSSNDPRSMALFDGIDGKALFDILLQPSAKVDKSEEDRYLGDIHKLRALVEGKRVEEITGDDGERKMLLTLSDVIGGAVSDPKKHVITCDIGAAAWLIDKAPGTLIFVAGLDAVHAEQNLILAYDRSGSKTPAHIYGKKRPCTGCYLTFRAATELFGLPISHSAMPGGYWGPARRGLFELMKQNKVPLAAVELFVQENLPDETFRTAPGRESGADVVKPRGNTSKELTALDSGSDTEQEDVELTREQVQKRRKKAAAAASATAIAEEDEQEEDEQ